QIFIESSRIIGLNAPPRLGFETNARGQQIECAGENEEKKNKKSLFHRKRELNKMGAIEKRRESAVVYRFLQNSYWPSLKLRCRGTALGAIAKMGRVIPAASRRKFRSVFFAFPEGGPFHHPAG